MRCAGLVVSSNVIERNVAEAAFLPITSVSHRHLVPTPVVPQAVHGIGHVNHREVFVETETGIARRWLLTVKEISSHFIVNEFNFVV